MLPRCGGRAIGKGLLYRSGSVHLFPAVLRRPMIVTAMPIAAAAVTAPCTLCAVKCREHTTAAAAGASSDDLSTQLNDLMDSFAEARELIKDAMESVGTTYFADDMTDAEAQAGDVLKRWADVQAFLEKSGAKEELQKLRNMHDLKIKQMEAELETVREAGGSA
ncbi:hypothetical protein ABL78_5159 [Leptomonas seymouri]|uniref:Uncharacterized protein n=1 Tax=Leptomonas seymouri TaxID=5684 RepID=A0A0N1IJJ7_LEPSE|nr:hypothetical protein ABL78_5159 [Leptomonas seymouri]|eukprot:KPI85768.1 hypothetical protein ABL78_5159 [Leptomonas seymouri]